MPTIKSPFSRLSTEIRILIFQLVLLTSEPINPAVHFYTPQRLNHGLLGVSRAIHSECSPIFYGQNEFDLSYFATDGLVSYLHKLGRNATHIKTIYIEFPEFHQLYTEQVTLRNNSLEALAAIRTLCTNLTELAFSLVSTTSTEAFLDALGDEEIATEAVAVVDLSLRAIATLQKITVMVEEEDFVGQTRREMKRRGWNITTEPLETKSQP